MIYTTRYIIAYHYPLSQAVFKMPLKTQKFPVATAKPERRRPFYSPKMRVAMAK